MATKSAGSGSKRVLVIDDSAIAAEALATALSARGFVVSIASSGAEAVEQVRADPPDVVVCDLHVPALDGASVLRAIARLDDTIPFVTASGDVDALHEGVFDHVRKTAGADAIFRAVQRAAEHGAIRRENRRLAAELRVGHEALERRVAERTAELAEATARLEQQRSREAQLDALTELGNRRLLRARLLEGLERARRAATPLSILIVDLDDFKPVNDSLGHATGDEVLVSTARRLRACAGPDDTCARLGGDDFAMVLPGAGAAEATAVARRVSASLAQPHRVGGADILLGASIGIAVSAAGNEGPDALLRDADLAMGAAKRRGGGHELFKPEMHAAMAASVALRLELRRAVERQEFFLEYQPVVAIPTGQIVGVEALVRWRHPERGIVPPGVFIALAEDTGLIVPLGRWVLREACAMLKRRGGGISLSVNVSARQLLREELVDDVAAAIADSGIEPGSLVLEVTESIALEERQPTLFALRGLGVRLAIDDFGTGYSSLAYLRRLPVDAVKIHKSFVDGVAGGTGDAHLARAILRFGQEMGLSTTAEGIEHAEQWSALRELGCDLGQGYYFSRPVGEERLTAAIASLPPPAA